MIFSVLGQLGACRRPAPPGPSSAEAGAVPVARGRFRSTPGTAARQLFVVRPGPPTAGCARKKKAKFRRPGRRSLGTIWIAGTGPDDRPLAGRSGPWAGMEKRGRQFVATCDLGEGRDITRTGQNQNCAAYSRPSAANVPAAFVVSQ